MIDKCYEQATGLKAVEGVRPRKEKTYEEEGRETQGRGTQMRREQLGEEGPDRQNRC